MLPHLHLIHFIGAYIDGLVQGCSNSSALAMKLLQSCTKPSICINGLGHHGYSSAISALSHYLNQRWRIVNCIPSNTFQWNLNPITNIFLQWDAFQSVVCKTLTLWLQCDNKTIWHFFPLFQIAREVELHRNLKNPHVVGFHSYFEDEDNVYIVLENCSRKVRSGFHTYGFQYVYQKHVGGLMQKRCNSSAFAVELHLFCTKSSTWWVAVDTMNNLNLFWTLEEPVDLARSHRPFWIMYINGKLIWFFKILSWNGFCEYYKIIAGC